MHMMGKAIQCAISYLFNKAVEPADNEDIVTVAAHTQSEEKLLNRLMHGIETKNRTTVDEVIGLIEKENNDIINFIDPKTKNTPLIQAVTSKNDEAVDAILKFPSTDLNVRDEKFKETALCVAICEGNIRAVKKILEVIDGKSQIFKKEFLDAKMGDVDRTILHFAIQNKNMDAFMELISYKELDPNIQDKELNTPLHLAVESGSLDLVWKLCIHSRIDLKKRNKNGLTPSKIATGDSKADPRAREMIDMFSKGTNLDKVAICKTFWPDKTPEEYQKLLRCERFDVTISNPQNVFIGRNYVNNITDNSKATALSNHEIGDSSNTPMQSLYNHSITESAESLYNHSITESSTIYYDKKEDSTNGQIQSAHNFSIKENAQAKRLFCDEKSDTTNTKMQQSLYNNNAKQTTPASTPYYNEDGDSFNRPTQSISNGKNSSNLSNDKNLVAIPMLPRQIRIKKIITLVDRSKLGMIP